MDPEDIVDIGNRQASLCWMRWLLCQRANLETFMSGFRKGRRCTFSPSAILHGTVNACIPIQYEDGKKWVLRLTVDGKGCDRDEKVKREIATMSFIRHYTTIPVPKVHHWGLARQNPL